MMNEVEMNELATEAYEYYTILLSKGLPDYLVQRMVGDWHEQIVSMMLVEDALCEHDGDEAQDTALSA